MVGDNLNLIGQTVNSIRLIYLSVEYDDCRT